MSENILKQDLFRIRQAALHAVNPGLAVQHFLRREENTLFLGDIAWDLKHIRRIYLVAAGKAAMTMSQATAEILGDALYSGIVVTKTGHASGFSLPPCLQVREAGHPVPDEAGLAAARAVANMFTNLTAQDRVIVLLSGGTSALLPLPVPGLSLSDLQSVTDALLRSGIPIGEMNAVRKHTDRLKGGQMARMAYPAGLAALILSDVVGDPLDVIASGPTTPDSSTYRDAWNVLERYQLRDKVTPAVAAHLKNGAEGLLPETPKPGDPLFNQVINRVIASNRIAAQAAVEQARLLGYNASLLNTFLEGEAREVGRVVASFAKGILSYGDPLPRPACLVLGGETTVTIHGSGVGGRNQELALSAAVAIDNLYDVALMALATDGTDGPTNCAGAIITGSTARLARSLGLDAMTALAENNAYPWLHATQSLMITGPTGTNVNDLLVLLVR